MEKDNIFERVREGLDWRLDSVIPVLLPGGRFRGQEYICASIEGGPGKSCSTNLKTGVGGDFSTDERWGDVIDLAARVWKIRPVEAARRLAEQYDLLSSRRPAPADYKRQAPPGNKGEGNVIPIIFFGPEPPERHPRLGTHTDRWLYFDEKGYPLHYVLRFGPRDRPGKQILPLCLCRLPDGTPQWQWRAWPVPRPLFNLHLLTRSENDAPVLLVEGEKTATAAQELFPDYVCMTWSGGCQAVRKADFTPLRGRNVIIWPDNDRAGQSAAQTLAEMLCGVGAAVRVLPLPSSLPEKWDLADTPPEGFDPQRYLRGASISELHAPVQESLQLSELPKNHPGETDYSAAEDHGPDFIRSWPVLHPDALPGFVGEFVTLATRDSEADPAAVLVTFLVRFGTEVYGFVPDKGPFIRIGESVHPPRLYTVIAGASAKARKGTSAKPVLRIFKDNPYKGRGAVPPAPHTGGPLSSGEGLAWRLRERDEVQGEDDDKADQLQDKRLFILDEEFAAAMASFKREGNTLSMAVRSMWDSGDYEPLTKNAQISVRGAHVGIVTHITIPEVRNKLDSMQISNGFANRFLWICARRTKEVPCPEAMPQAEFQVLYNELWRRIRLAQGRGELRFTPESRDYWASIYSDLSRDIPGAGGDIVARGEAQCVRLALIYALLDGPLGREDAIDVPHLKAALALWQYARDSALYIFGNMEEEETSRKIYAVLRESPKSTTELYALFNRHIQNSRLQACLQELVGRGLVEKRAIRTAGRPKIVYCVAKKEKQG